MDPDHPGSTQFLDSLSGLAGGLRAGESLRIMNLLAKRLREPSLSVETHPMWSFCSLIMAVC